MRGQLRRTERHRARLLRTTALAVLMGAVLPAGNAAAADWNGSVSTDWFDGANWDGGSPPGAGNGANISNGNPAEIGQPGAAAGAVRVLGGSELTIDGGTLNSHLGIVGNLGSPGTATITGADSVWNNASEFVVGWTNGSIGTLDVLNGGTLTTTTGWIGSEQTAQGFVNVSGAGSTWTATGELVGFPDDIYIGDFGTGTLTISDGGRVAAGAVTLGHRGDPGVVNTINIGAAAGQAAVGAGTLDADTVTVLNGTGAFVFNHTDMDYEFRADISGAGTIDVYSGGTALTGDSSAFSGPLVIHSGALEVAGKLTVDDVTMFGGQLGVSGELTAGSLMMEGGTAWITGQFATNATSYIGWDDGQYGSMTLSGPNADWTQTGLNTIYVGAEGNGTLRIDNGASMSVREAVVGWFAPSDSSATVTGAGSVLNADALTVGVFGKGDLKISDGGTVNGIVGIIGERAGSEGTALITGAGSAWIVTNALAVGESGTATLTVADGGRLAASTIVLAGGTDGTGVVNIGAGLDDFGAPLPPAAPGVLDTNEVRFDDGTATLNFNQTAADYLFSPELTGDGTINHYAGTTILTADSSSFGGTTWVRGGSLFVGTDTSALGGTIYVEDGGTLGGVGSLGAVNVLSGGTIATGTFGAGQLSVNGNLFMNAGSTFEVADLSYPLAVTGVAAFDFNVAVHISGTADININSTYEILEAAGGVINQFDSVTSDFTFLDAVLTHNPNSVDVAFTRNAVAFASAAQTPNQIAAAGALDGFDPNDWAAQEFAAMTADEARAGFDLISGEVHATGQSVVQQAFGAFSTMLKGQGQAGLVGAGAFTAPLGYVARAETSGLAAIDAVTGRKDGGPHGAWVTPLGAVGSLDGDGNAAGFDWNAFGMAGGYQSMLDLARGTAVAGFGLGYLRSGGEVDARMSGLDADGFYAGGFAAWADGPLSVSGSLAYSANKVNTDRHILVAGIYETAEAEYWVHMAGLSGEAAYAVPVGGLTFAPLATLDAGIFAHDGATETGAGSLNAVIASEEWTRLDTGLGLAVSHRTTLGGGVTAFEARAVWEHAFADVVPEQGITLSGGGPAFVVLGPGADRDRARLGLSLGYAEGDLAVHARYDGTFSASEESHAGSFGLSRLF